MCSDYCSRDDGENSYPGRPSAPARASLPSGRQNQSLPRNARRRDSIGPRKNSAEPLITVCLKRDVYINQVEQVF